MQTSCWSILTIPGSTIANPPQGNRMSRFSPLPPGKGPGEREKHRCIHRLKPSPQPLSQRDRGCNISSMNGKNGGHGIARQHSVNGNHVIYHGVMILERYINGKNLASAGHKRANTAVRKLPATTAAWKGHEHKPA